MIIQVALLFISVFFCNYARASSNYLIGCEILDSKMAPIKQFHGHACVFLNDGSWISAGYSDLTLEKFSPEGKVLWSRKIDAHHGLNISEDRNRLLVLGSEFVSTENCKARYDQLMILNAKNGETIAQYSLFKNRDLFFKKYLNHSLTNLHEENTRGDQTFSCRFTHFNTLREIGENSMATQNPAFAKGNIIASIWDTSWIFIFDKDLKKIIWDHRLKEQSEEGVHDVQVLSDGKILFYNNKATDEIENISKIQIFDDKTKSTVSIFPAKSSNSIFERLTQALSPKPKLYSREMGGVQKIGDNYLFNVNSDQLGGLSILVDSNGQEIFRKPYHHKDKSGKAAFFLEVKQADLSDFLKNNKM